MIATAIGRRRLAVLALFALAAAITLATALATLPSASGQEKSPAPQASPYLPSVSDMMIATIQPRHRRLWQAEQDKNWAFAAYELGNLHGAFKRLGEAHPTEHDMSLPDMIASVTEQPFDELKAAVQSKDDAKFAKAYADLTDGCNSCHQAFNHGVVVIKVPGGASVSDQDFTQAGP
jgi:HAMP domain-containing protein